MTTSLCVDDVSIDYGSGAAARPVLRNISFRVAPGEAYGLVGESGCGKSTLALAVMRALPPAGVMRGGRVLVAGEDVHVLAPAGLRRLRAERVSMVYQDPGRALNPSLTIGRQVAEVFELLGTARGPARQDAARILARVRIDDAAWVMQAYPHQLSGGMQQRVVLAMALAKNPALLVLDEPTTGLDATVEASVLDLIAELRREFSTAMLFISHNLPVVARVCDRVGVLHNGALVEEGRAAEVLRDPRHAYTAELLRHLPSGSVARTRHAGGDGAPVLEVDGVSRLFCTGKQIVRAVHDVSLRLRAGETLGLVGESGSGKTTLARLILGMEAPDAGCVRLDGQGLAARAAARGMAQREAVQMVFQNPDSALNRAHRVRHILARPLARLLGLRGASLRRRVEEMAASVRLETALLAVRPGALSGGQKQRVAIARAFAGAPRVVVCDEPTSALDVAVQASVLRLLADLQAGDDVAYLLISHDLAAVRFLADRMAVMYRGQIVQVGDTEAVLAGPHHPYTETLLAAAGLLPTRPALAGVREDAVSTGCSFQARCHRLLGPVCVAEPPGLHGTEMNAIRCHHLI